MARSPEQERIVEGLLPLEGIKIIDLTSAIAGPMGAMLLGDDGAKIIKVEPPGGDLARKLPPFEGSTGLGYYFASANRNKRSLGLDLRSPYGMKIVYRLIEDADGVIVNIPSLEKMREFGLDIQSLAKLNPKIIEVAVSLEGHTGPKEGRKGYDLIIQAALSMLMTGSKDDNCPNRYPGPLVDVLTALNVQTAFYKALRIRENSAEPMAQFVDVSLREAIGITMFAHLAQVSTLGEDVPREGDDYPYIHPYATRPTKDGYLALAVGSENNWRCFSKLLVEQGILSEEVILDVRFSSNALRVQNRAELDPIIDKILLQRTAREWEDLFIQYNIPAESVKTVLEFINDPQTQARQIMLDLKNPEEGSLKVVNNPLASSGLPIRKKSSFPPKFGEHTDEILLELGYSQPEIMDFRASETVF